MLYHGGEVIIMLQTLQTTKKRWPALTMALTLLQGITVLLGALGLMGAYFLLTVGVQAAMDGPVALGLDHAQWLWLLTVGFAAVGVVSVACGAALISFFRMCSRLKRGSAFTRQNQRAMGRIALCCLVAGVTLAAGDALLWQVVPCAPCVMMLLGACLFLSVAAVAWALGLLVRRAVSLQDEVDLTV